MRNTLRIPFRTKLRSSFKGFPSEGSMVIPIDSIQTVIPSAIVDLDATADISYSGSGNLWKNIVDVPADGAQKTDYDFNTGDGSTSSTFPSFNGTAGSPSAYWEFTGTSYFRIASNSNTNFLNNLHKTTGGTDFWFCFVVYNPDLNWPLSMLFSTTTTMLAGADNKGIDIRATTLERFGLRQYGGSSANSAILGSASTVAFSNQFYIVIVSHSHSTNTTNFWVNSTTGTALAQTFQTETADAFSAAVIGSFGTGDNPMASGWRIVHFSAGNEYLNDAKAADIFAFLEQRHGRDYTP